MPLSFDRDYYLQDNPDVAQAVEEGLIPSAEYHWINFGAAEGRDPNATFDTEAYLAANPDVAEAFEQDIIAPFAHFLQYGAAESRAPNADYQAIAEGFDEQAYLEDNPDVADAIENGVLTNAYEHWVLYGQYEDRPEATLMDGTPVSEVIENDSEDAGEEEPAEPETPPVDETPDDGGEEPTTPPVDEGDDGQTDGGTSDWSAISAEQILTVEGGTENTFYTSEDLAAVEATDETEGHIEYQAIRFSGIEEQQITVEGLAANKWVFVENSDMTLNLNEMESSQVKLEGSNVTLQGDTEIDDPEATTPSYSPTGLMSSLTVAVAGDSNSSLDLSGSAVEGLSSLTLNGSGNLDLSGSSPLYDEGPVDAAVAIDASAMTGSLTITNENGELLDNAASVTTGSGDDTITAGDISDADGTVLSINGGAGEDTLTVTGSMTTDGDFVGTEVSNFETVTFESYSEIDAGTFTGAGKFFFASGGSISNLGTDQTVTATSAGGGSPLILRDVGETANVVADFTGDEVLELQVNGGDEEADSTLNLSGDGAVAYTVGKANFDTIDAAGLNGGLEFTGADYNQEDVTLGSGSDTLNVAESSIFGSDGDRIDSIMDFEAGTDTLEIGALSSFTSVEIATGTTLTNAFETAASESTDGSYVAFELGSNTYIYADTETQSTDTEGNVIDETGEVGVSYNDFAIELADVQGIIQSPSAGTTDMG